MASLYRNHVLSAFVEERSAPKLDFVFPAAITALCNGARNSISCGFSCRQHMQKVHGAMHLPPVRGLVEDKGGGRSNHELPALDRYFDRGAHATEVSISKATQS
jgi:hypothetical protein